MFCLEGDWDSNIATRSTTVEPVLQLLEKSNYPRSVPYVHRDIGTLEEFEYYLSKWSQQRYRGYPILYLAFHGGPGELYVGDQRRSDRRVHFDWLEERLGGRCRNRVIHLGSCGTIAVRSSRLQAFLQATGAVAVCGFRSDVHWITSSAFEALLMSYLQENAFTRSGLLAVERRIRSEAGGLARRLRFHMAVRA